MGEKKRRLAANLPATSAAPSSSDTLARARQLLQRGLLTEAVNLYQAVLRQTGVLTEAERAEATHFQGLAIFQSGQAGLGLSLMQQALQWDAGNPVFHLNCGLAQKDAAAALPFFQAAHGLASDDAAICLTLAQSLLQLSQIDEAIGVLAAGPKASANLDLLAQLYYKQQQSALAQSTFQQALALNPALRQQRMIGFQQPNAAARSETAVAASFAPTAASAANLLNLSFDDYLQQLDLHIIDDFLPDFAAWRAQALQKDFKQSRYSGQNYPGLQTDGEDCSTIMQQLANHLGQTIQYISPDNGSYRISFADSTARTDIHVDNEAGEQFNSYAAVLYLNTPEQCQGGTVFWQHGPSGWLGRPPDTVVRTAGYADFTQFQKRHLPRQSEGVIFNELSQMHQEWQPVLQVPMRANRLILYRGDFFHSIGQVFGSTLADGRLVQLFFFDVVDNGTKEHHA